MRELRGVTTQALMPVVVWSCVDFLGDGVCMALGVLEGASAFDMPRQSYCLDCATDRISYSCETNA